MKNFMKVVINFVFALVIMLPISVFAATEITSDDLTEAQNGDTSKGFRYDEEEEKYVFSDGEYILGEDLDLSDTFFVVIDANVTFDLNDKELSTDRETYGAIEAYGESVVTITGNGTVSGTFYSVYSGGKTVINIENGTYNGRIDVHGDEEDGEVEYAYLNIKSGTFNSAIYVDHANAVIDDGTFDTTESDADALYVSTGSSIEINGGTFISPYSGVIVEPYAPWNEETESFEYEGTIKSVVINGGTFTGESAGLSVINTENLEINEGIFNGKKVGFVFGSVENMRIISGTFKAEGEEALGGIAVIGDNEELLNDILAENSEFDPALEATVKQVEDINIVATQNEISVVNIKINDYKYLEGENLDYDSVKDDIATFKINTEYKYFKDGGMVYVDDELVDEKNYTSESGSTVIKLSKEYMASLKTGEHTLKVVFNNEKEATTKFTIKEVTNTTNPQTLDNISLYVSVLFVGIIAIISTLYLIKKSEN